LHPFSGIFESSILNDMWQDGQVAFMINPFALKYFLVTTGYENEFADNWNFFLRIGSSVRRRYMMLPDSMLEIIEYMPYERFEIKHFLQTVTDRESGSDIPCQYE
jgi:hypothetical protein